MTSSFINYTLRMARRLPSRRNFCQIRQDINNSRRVLILNSIRFVFSTVGVPMCSLQQHTRIMLLPILNRKPSQRLRQSVRPLLGRRRSGPAFCAGKSQQSSRETSWSDGFSIPDQWRFHSPFLWEGGGESSYEIDEGSWLGSPATLRLSLLENHPSN